MRKAQMLLESDIVFAQQPQDGRWDGERGLERLAMTEGEIVRVDEGMPRMKCEVDNAEYINREGNRKLRCDGSVW